MPPKTKRNKGRMVYRCQCVKKAKPPSAQLNLACERLRVGHSGMEEDEVRRRWEVLRVCQVPWLIQNRRGQAASFILEVVLGLVVLVGLWSESRFSTFWDSDQWGPDTKTFMPLQKALKLSWLSREDVRKTVSSSFLLTGGPLFLRSIRKTTSCDWTVAPQQLTTTASILCGCSSEWQLFMPPPPPCWDPQDAFPSIPTAGGVLASPLDIPLPVGAALEQWYRYLQPCVRAGFILPFCLTLVWGPRGISRCGTLLCCAEICELALTPNQFSFISSMLISLVKMLNYVPILCRCLFIASLLLHAER